MVLAAGFVVYILWGFLLNNLLNKLEDMQPDKVLQYELDKELKLNKLNVYIL
jgi:hypothetical protein